MSYLDHYHVLIISGVFCPTLFSKVFGDLACDKCKVNITGYMNETTGLQCSGCKNSVVGALYYIALNKHYENTPIQIH